MTGWHHRLNGPEFEQTLGDGEEQGSLVCCSPWGHKKAGHDLATEQQHCLQCEGFTSWPKMSALAPAIMFPFLLLLLLLLSLFSRVQLCATS